MHLRDATALPALIAGFATPRLRVLPRHPDHAPDLFDWMQDPAVYDWIDLPPPAEPASLHRRLSRGAACSLPDRELELAWTVQRLADGRFIGALDVNIAGGGVASNVGYMFSARCWGLGLASEAVAGLCAHLDRHGITEQHATVTLGNRASCRLLERVGFTPLGVLLGHDVLRGVPVDDVAYRRGGASAA